MSTLTNIQDNTKNTIIRKACPYCKVLAKESSREIVNRKIKIKLECKHTIIEELVESTESEIISHSGKKPFPYQYKTLEFIENSNFRTGIFHEQGVGKTICSLMTIAKHKEKLVPFAVICKSSLKTQWWKEIFEWTGFTAQIITSGSDKVYPELFDCFILSYDLIRSNNFLSSLNIKLVIMDECQQIKNGQAKRTKAIREAIKDIPHVLALSGTPIKNHAGEYFPVLNILKPERFPSQAQFERDYLDTYQNGYTYKIGGIKRHQTDEFKRITEDFIIRYDRDEVLPDLPKIFRKNFFVELGAEVEAAYKKAFIEFQEAYEEQEYGGKDKFSEAGNLLAKLNRMRQITGIAKVLPITDFSEEFLEENDRKIALFVHHKAVGEGLFNNISKVCQGLKIHPPVRLTSENAGNDSGSRIDEEWKTNKDVRVMIASTLSAGEGKNWQMCSDMIMVEHQWNPGNEEQCETRFPRPCPICGQKCICGLIGDKIQATYAIALGTPDEYLTEIKERKREICKKTMGNESVQWDQSSVIKELSEMLMRKGGKKWNL